MYLMSSKIKSRKVFAITLEIYFTEKKQCYDVNYHLQKTKDFIYKTKIDSPTLQYNINKQ